MFPPLPPSPPRLSKDRGNLDGQDDTERAGLRVVDEAVAHCRIALDSDPSLRLEHFVEAGAVRTVASVSREMFRPSAGPPISEPASFIVN